MSDSYGKKVGSALSAIRAMHSDVSRLFQDCDGTIGKGRPSVFTNYVTRDLTWSLNGPYWMADGVYRYYDASDRGPGVATGLTAYFLDEKSLSQEPLLLVGEIGYRFEGKSSLKGVCKEWDLWDAFFEWSTPFSLVTVLTPQPRDVDRISWVKVIGVPLYSITGMSDVENLMAQVDVHPANTN